MVPLVSLSLSPAGSIYGNLTCALLLWHVSCITGIESLGVFEIPDIFFTPTRRRTTSRECEESYSSFADH